ncbi:MAG: orotate phosphoribosyltransferase, partial [Gammaproteobacteria bacterium]
IGLIRAAGATPAALVVAIDREERGRSGEHSAIRELAAEEGIEVRALISFSDVLAWLEESGSHGEECEALLAYREQYGATA